MAKKKTTAKAPAKKRAYKKRETKALIIPENNLPSSTFASADLAINRMLESGIDPEKLEKLLEVKGKYEAEENKKAFQIKFSQLQSELPVIEKTKEVRTTSGQLLYKYAPLEKIIEQIKPLLLKHGFSYRWSEGLTEKKDFKRTYCTIMACGHQEESFVDIPMMAATKTTNIAQQAGSSSTYGKRYSLIAALGIMADEDDGGAGITKKNNLKSDKTEDERKQLIAKFTLTFQQYAAMEEPTDKLNQFMAHIDTMDEQEIQRGLNGLNIMINKIKEKKL